MINKDPLYKFCTWFSFFIFICFIGIFKVFALTNNNSIRFYDNNGNSLTYKDTTYVEQTGESSAVFTTTANSYGGAVLITLNTPLIQNHIYSLFMNVGAANMGGQTQISSKNCIGIGSNYQNAINSYINCSITPSYTQKSGVTYDKQRGIYFNFIANANASFIVVPYTSTDTCYDCYQYSYGFDITDGGDTSGLNQTQVNNIINQQTQTIQNQISNMQNSVSNSIDDMSSSITNSINDNFNSCVDNVPKFKSSLNAAMYYNSANSKVQIESSSTLSTLIYEVETLGSYTFTFKNYNRLRVYLSDTLYENTNLPVNVSGTLAINNDSPIIDETYTLNVDKKYIYMYLSGNSSVPGEVIFNANGQTCTNRLDQQTNAINDLNDNINDDNTDGATSEASEFFSDFNTNTFGLTSIITAPLNLIQSLTSQTCTPLHLPLPYMNNKYLDLPCMSTIYSQHFGSFFTLYQTITYGIIAYWVCVRIFNHVKDFKNPEHDEIEVVDL